MQSLSAIQKNTIITMLDSGHSGHSIATSTGFHTSTISRLCVKECSELQKSTGGCPSKLSPANVHSTINVVQALAPAPISRL
ncbi:hypothetical protein PAXRUDRAFT_146239 [Paxillus rubicundulus Ve08.2h10]|uniref:Uncharacterized protein n=1 Tax=Paxillus rubicundulus Ve08.2h10 TaxID=930991 RepID=A0A0D0D7R5_9AGAM|nr:hypothetical protein PAXRUDRAFT_146239 [Paxillus rubicundulus Ve08.2h10]